MHVKAVTKIQYLITAVLLIGYLCWNTDAYVEIGIATLPYEVTESENITQVAIYVYLLYGTPNSTVAVELRTANGNALSGIDYIQEQSVVEFEPNSTQGNSLCAYITILSDYAVEDTENFTVYLTSNSTDVSIPTYAQSVQVQILEGAFQYIDVSFAASMYSVNKNQGYVQVCVEIMSGLLMRSANVYLSTHDVTAISLTHYLPLQSFQVQFLPGDQTNSTRCVNITVLNDMITEGTKYFTVLLTTNDTAINEVVPTNTTVAIQDSDYVVVSLAETAYNTSERLGYVTICAKIVMGTLGRSLSVYATTIDGTATEVNFIQVQSYPLLFTSGQRQNDTACFNITVIDNNITENTNFFTVYISGNDTGLHLAPPTNATVGISDSDYITVAFNSTTISTNESSRYVTVCVGILTGVLGRNASVYISTVDGTAIKSTNYATLQYAELQLISGDEMNSSRCLQVTVFDEMITENTKYFNVLLTTNDTGVIVVAPNSTTVAIEDSDYVLVSLTASMYNTSESVGYATVCAKIIVGTLGRSIDVYLSTMNGTAAAGSNFIQIQSYPLTFSSGNRQNDSTCFNITVIDDMITEYTNYFTVVMVSNDTGVHLAAPINATVSIADSDNIVLGFTSPTVATNESYGYATVCVGIQTGVLGRNASVYLSTVDGTAIKSKNYSPLQYAEVQFLYGDHSNSTRCINITVFDDMITENTNYFQVSITTNDSAVHLTPTNSTTIAIGDSDYVVVSFTASTYNTSEKVGYVMVCAEIVLGTLGRPVNVFVSTVIGTATGQNFIQVQSYPLLFVSGRKENDTSCLNITVIDDMITENVNYFTVTITSNDTGVHLEEPTNAIVYITDSDIVMVSLTETGYNTSESVGYVAICAKIVMGTLGRSLSVYASTIYGTATGINFIQVQSYPLLFTSGKRQNDTACFNITVIDDNITENTNVFTVYIYGNDTGLHLAPPTNATVGISDSDYITVAFNSATIATNESSRYVTVCVVILRGVLGRNASVYLSTVDGTAIKSTNYAPLHYAEMKLLSGDGMNSSRCLQLTVFDDMITESTKYLNVLLTTNDTGVIAVAPNSTTVAIEDSDYVVVSFTASMYNTSESVGYVTMCAKIIVGTLGRSIDVYLSTMNGTAAAGSNFIQIQSYPLSLSSGKGQNDSTCFNITVIDDMITEYTNYFTVVMFSNDTGVHLAAPINATVSIADNDNIVLGFTSPTVATNESYGYATVCVGIQTGVLGRNASVYLSTVDGTAIKSKNYSPLQYAEVQFLYGDHSNSTRCINITVFDDMITENTNYFQVSITTNDSAVHLTPPNSTTIAIGDSDYVVVSFATSTYNTSEKVGYVMVCAKIVLGTLGRPINVFASTLIGTATGQNFIQVQSYPLLFVSGRKENDTSCLNITVIDDMITKNVNYFTVTITSNDTGVHLEEPTNATVYITDSDIVMVSLTETAYSTSESVGYVTICAKIVMGTLGRSLSIYASTIYGTATGINYIQVQSYPLLFTSGKRQNDTACFNITVIDNNITENTNVFTVYIYGNDTGLHLAPPTNATVGISDSDNITVAFNSATIATNESSGYVTVCVVILRGVLGRNASVYLSTVDGTAIKSTNYAPLQYAEMKLLSGDEMNSSRCLQLTVFDDMITENTKYFNVLLTTNGTGVIAVAPNSTTVAIEDSDYVVVSFTASMYNTSESVGYVTVCAKIIVGTLGRSIDVYLSTMNGTAAAGSNFIQIQSYPLSFSSGKRQNDSTCFNITVIDDMITENTNYFTVVMVSNDTGVHLAAPINATVSIADSDNIVLGFTSPTVATDESSGYATVCVGIQTGVLGRNASVYLSTVDGTAIKSKNYSPLQYAEVQFLYGDHSNSTRCINITVFDDMITENTNYFQVSITTNDTAVHVTPPNTTTIAIGDSDYVVVSFATSMYNTSEKVGYVMVCAEIVLGTLGRPVNVFASTVIGTATGQNFIQVQSYPLLFVSGRKENDTSCLNITVIDDMITENVNYFTVTITSNDTGVDLEEPTNATVYITDSDIVMVSFTETAYNTSECVGYVTICAKIVMGTLGRSLSVYASTIYGTATGINFIQVQIYPLLFTSGKRQNDTACFNITVIDDNITENTNFFTVYIYGNDTGLHLAPPTNATVGISDSDYITVAFNSATIATNESSGYVTVCVVILRGVLGRNASVYLSTVDGTAIKSTNYAPLQYAEMKLLSGDEMNSSRCLQLTVFDDMITENTKYFNVLLTTNDTGVIAVAPNSTTVAIEDSDYVVVSFTASMYNTSESVGYVTVCAKIIVGTLGRSIDVYLSTMNGTAAAGSNFIQIQSYPLSFSSGKRQNDSTCFNITVIDDMITENTNYFTVVMVSNDTGVHLAAPINATVSIADSDYIVLGFTSPTIATNESSGYAKVCVGILTGVLGRNASVYLSTVDGTAIKSKNYSPLQYAEVRFLYGDHSNSTRCINITVFGDMITENINYFQVSITTNDSAVHVTPPNTTTIAIGDSDYVVVSFTASTYNTSEKVGYVMVCVKIVLGTLGRPVNVFASAMIGTATGRNFVQVQSYPLLFISGQAENDTTCLNITVIDDMITENLNYFTVAITSNDTGVHLAVPTNATVYITDSDNVVVSLNSNTYYTNESMGFVMVCTKIIMGILERSGSVYLSTMNGTATDRNFAQVQSYPVTFVGGKQNDTACFNITVIDDMIVENTKYFTLYIISNDTGVVLTAPTNATVWIADSNYITVAFTSPIYITNRSAGYTEVCAEILKGALENVVGVHVYLTTADNTATAGEDYYAVDLELVFISGQGQNGTSCTNITILDDAYTDGVQNFTISLNSNTTTVQLAVPTNATIIINDVNYISVSLTSSTYNTSEGDGYFDVCAEIVSGYLKTSVVVYISTYNGTAATDFVPIKDLKLWFYSDDTQNDTVCDNITILHDMLTETTETFIVSIASNDSYVRLIPPTTAMVFIKDIDSIEVGFTQSVYNGSAGSTTQVCVRIYSGNLNAIVNLGTDVNGTLPAGSAFSPPNINFTLMNGDGVGTVHCVNISLLQEANVITNQQFNVTLLLLTADITVYFKGRTTIILIFNTVSDTFSAAALAAILTGIISILIVFFIVILIVYTLVCVSMIKKASVKKFENNEFNLTFPLKPEYASAKNLRDKDTLEMLGMIKLESSMVIENETVI